MTYTLDNRTMRDLGKGATCYVILCGKILYRLIRLHARCGRTSPTRQGCVQWDDMARDAQSADGIRAVKILSGADLATQPPYDQIDS
ncbi:hypothetical protein CBOM_08021 [Ceraceosorus bombacis]|uniref:Uncharacterized protein n=1 Tax=Ceraceosorus bombacis TaxID=401625 RepID=A0A0P1BT00_9BASI|nr:hypothetical protein CBOM_08021 [Ceraceosorus bombacis]